MIVITFLRNFHIILSLIELIVEMDEYHSVHFINENGEEIFSIPAPFMFDSSDSVECNYNIEVEFEKYEDGYLYSIIPDNE